MKRLRLNQILAILIFSMVFNLGGDLLNSSPAGVTADTIVNIEITDNRFFPQNLSVSAGSTVVWTNNGASPHTTTSDTGLWDSGTLLRGQTFSRSFDTPGTYPYNCIFHRGAGMVGTITVVAPTSTATPTPTATATAIVSNIWGDGSKPVARGGYVGVASAKSVALLQPGLM
ncbi:MAG: plastocyanin/azurin family copper-binding protein, partial [Dehalococcoidia bacterium]|nr:plastocyanin/azurin family copper-binding protein [Dehalococcoidia bacterium]